MTICNETFTVFEEVQFIIEDHEDYGIDDGDCEAWYAFERALEEGCAARGQSLHGCRVGASVGSAFCEVTGLERPCVSVTAVFHSVQAAAPKPVKPAYTGHLAGSPIQAHSAGDTFPFTIQVRDIERTPGHWSRHYEVLPTGVSFMTYESAERYARACRTVRTALEVQA